MRKLLSKDEVAGYRDRGNHLPIDALSASEVADFRRCGARKRRRFQ